MSIGRTSQIAAHLPEGLMAHVGDLPKSPRRYPFCSPASVV